MGASSHNEQIESFTATGPQDAFSAWSCGNCSTSNRNLDFVLHWNGQGWRSIGLPVPLTYPRFVTSISASSASNLWALNDSNKLGIWNGSRWAVKVLPSWVLRATRVGSPDGQAAVLARGNAWVFSIGASQPTLAAHFVHSTWHKVSLPVAPYGGSVVSSRDMWVVGITKKSLSTTRPVWAAAHWDGSVWHVLMLPKVSAGNAAYGLAAVGTSNIWLVRQVESSHHTVKQALLHWTGRWHVIGVPLSAGSLGSIAQDGHGGVWLTAIRGSYPAAHAYFDHYASGRWTRQAEPASSGMQTLGAALTWIPGTRSLWATGEASHAGIGIGIGVILKYGP